MFRLCTPSFYLSFVLCLACCSGSSSFQAQAAHTVQDQPMSFNVEGTINTLGQNKLTLRAEENVIFHVSYDDKTEIRL